MYAIRSYYVRYITFRTTLAVITGMVISLVIGPGIIRWLKKISVTQQIRNDSYNFV